MAKIKVVEDLISQGDNPLNATTVLKTINKDFISIDDDVLKIDCSFSMPPSYLEYPNVPVIVMLFTYVNDKGDTITNIYHSGIRDGFAYFGLPLNYETKLTLLMVGYSNGYLGGFTKPFYHDKIRRSFYYYDTSVFDTNKFDYRIIGDKIDMVKTLIKYEKSHVELLKYGHGANYGDGHVYGGLA